MNKNLKILVLGYSGAGKTSAANFMAGITGGKVANESDYIIIDFANHIGENVALIKQRKFELRDSLYDFARTKQHLDPTYPVKLAFADGATIVTGTRNPDELQAKRDMYDLIVWISRDGFEAGSTDKLEPCDADVEITATDLHDLEMQVTALLMNLG